MTKDSSQGGGPEAVVTTSSGHSCRLGAFHCGNTSVRLYEARRCSLMDGYGDGLIPAGCLRSLLRVAGAGAPVR